MKPSEAYMVGFAHGCADLEKDETDIPEKCLAAYGDGHEYGRERRVFALEIAKGFDVLDEVNTRAFAMWNLNNHNLDLPLPPPGSGCRFHYCWMPVDTRDDNHSCKAHGGKDAPLPKKRET